MRPRWITCLGLEGVHETTGLSKSSIFRILAGTQTSAVWEVEYAPHENLKDEDWKAVPQYWFKKDVSGIFVIASYGAKTSSGYCFVQRNGIHFFVHRLVAAAFLEDEIIAAYERYLVEQRNKKN